MYYFRVIGTHNPVFGRMSYGIQAEVWQRGSCTYAAYIPDISCNKAFVDKLAQRCTDGRLSPMHLLDVVLDALP